MAANSSWNLQNFRTGIIRELLHRGHEVITLSPDMNGIAIGPAAVPHKVCQMQRSGMNPIRDIALFGRLVKVLMETRPDIYFGFTIKPNIYGSIACKLLNIPAIPNVSGLGTSFLGGGILRKATLGMYRIAFAGATRVHFQNTEDREFFIEHQLIRAGQSRVLPGSGVNLANFLPADLPHDLRFLMIARLLGDKGVREYVEAARLFKRRVPSARFLLLGELDQQNPTAVSQHELASWIQDDVITYLGSTSDVRPFIRDAAAVVLPSYREGLPRTLLEGAAMGRPLIGTDVAGCREVVREGVTGFLCQPRNSASLATAFARLAETPHDKRLRMGAEARSMVEKEFDEAFVIGAYIDLVEGL